MNNKREKILILGGSGFIGSNLVKSLSKGGYHLRLLLKNNEHQYLNHADNEIEIFQGDFRTIGNYKELLANVSTVIHLIHSTFPGSTNDDPLADVTENLIPTLQLVKACITYKVSKLIFISSGGAIYGKAKYLPIDENHSLEPISSYGLTKLTIERYLQYYTETSSLNTIILRVSNPYGPGQKIGKNQGLIGVFANQLLAGLPLKIFGSGETIRDFIYVDDVIDAIKIAINESEIKFDIFNIGSGEGKSINEILMLFKKLHNKSIDIEYLPGREIDVPVNILNAKKFEILFNWKGRGVEEQILKKFIE